MQVQVGIPAQIVSDAREPAIYKRYHIKRVKTLSKQITAGVKIATHECCVDENLQMILGISPKHQLVSIS